MTKYMIVAAAAVSALATQAAAQTPQGEDGGRMQRDISRQQTQQMSRHDVPPFRPQP